MQNNLAFATDEQQGVARRLEMEARVRRFLADFASHCIATVPASRRADCTHWLADMKRHQAFVEQVADLIEASRHTKALSLSSVIAALEAEDAEFCRFEASLAEGRTNATLNEAQEMAAREDCPSKWSLVYELCAEQVRATKRLMQVAARHMHLARAQGGR